MTEEELKPKEIYSRDFTDKQLTVKALIEILSKLDPKTKISTNGEWSSIDDVMNIYYHPGIDHISFI